MRTAVLLAPLLGPPPALVPATEPGPNPVYGGQLAEPCQLPTTISTGGCSGVLVHPQVVMYAAHCGDRVGSVAFGESAGMKRVNVSKCEVKQNTGRAGPEDYAYCVLSNPVTDVPITPPLYGCELNEISRGREAYVSGYGAPFGFKKSWAKTEVGSPSMGMILVGHEGVGGGPGDSGGPAYMQLEDGSWRAFGIHSGGDDNGENPHYVYMSTAVPWVEERSGIDITPCHDVSGAWAPTEACGGFATTPLASGGSWDDFCGSLDPLSGPSRTCGPAFGEGAGEESSGEGSAEETGGEGAESLDAGTSAGATSHDGDETTMADEPTAGGVPGATSTPGPGGGGSCSAPAGAAFGTLPLFWIALRRRKRSR